MLQKFRSLSTRSKILCAVLILPRLLGAAVMSTQACDQLTGAGCQQSKCGRNTVPLRCNKKIRLHKQYF